MLGQKVNVVVLSWTCFLFVSLANAAPPTRSIENEAGHALPDYDNVIRPFLKSYCFDCHDSNTQEGNVRLDDRSPLVKSDNDAQIWQDVLDVINIGKMPPKDEKRPPLREYAEVLATFSQSVDTIRHGLRDTGGYVPPRRLNRRERTNDIRRPRGLVLIEIRLLKGGTHGSHQGRRRCRHR